MTAPLKADQVAAERLLKAAVRRGIDMLRGLTSERTPADRVVLCYTEPDHEAVVAMLTAAGESAALLLGEATS